jgi:hypothetical protein
MTNLRSKKLLIPTFKNHTNPKVKQNTMFHKTLCIQSPPPLEGVGGRMRIATFKSKPNNRKPNSASQPHKKTD